MTREGPPLDLLLHRLAACPPDFLAEPRWKGKGTIETAAVVKDLLWDLGHGAPDGFFVGAWDKNGPEEPNRLRLVQVACWLLGDPWFSADGTLAAAAHRLLVGELDFLANLVDAEAFVTDPDRREELARRCLSELGLRPHGESEAQAKDRLASLDTVERSRVITETREAEERAARVREEIEQKAREAAAAKVSRE